MITDSIYSALHASATKHPSKHAIFFSKERITYSELILKIDSFALYMESKGIRKGDRVAVLLKNSLEFIVSVFGCLKQGIVCVPLNFFLATDELIYILNDCRAPVLFSSGRNFSRHFSRITEEVNNIKELIDMDDLNPEEQPGIPGERPPASYDDPAMILYTSGTTGHPKGAVLTHKNFISNVENCIKAIKITDKDSTICFLPLFHSFAFTVCLLMPLYLGGHTVLLDSIPSGSKFLRLIFFNKISIFAGIPQIYSLFLKIPAIIGRLAFWRVKYFISGADCLPPSIMKRFEEKFKKPLIEGYGLTEASPVVALNRPEKRKAGFIGLPLPGVSVMIVDDSGKEVPHGDVGEITVKGDNVMSGYFECPEATKNTIRKGWLYTGDLGYIDEDGYIKIVDRKKDMIICKGLNVYTREIENVLRDIPQVEDAAVIGVTIRPGVEIPVAFIKKNGNMTSRQITAYCRKRLAGYKVPRKVIFLEEFPYTATKKISKKELKKRFVGAEG